MYKILKDFGNLCHETQISRTLPVKIDSYGHKYTTITANIYSTLMMTEKGNFLVVAQIMNVTKAIINSLTLEEIDINAKQ
jgi:hypothetical protein